MFAFVDRLGVDESAEHGAEDRVTVAFAKHGAGFGFADAGHPALAGAGEGLKCFARFQEEAHM